jgi:hypothetical protein
MVALASGNLTPPDPNADLRIPNAGSGLASRVQAQGGTGIILSGPQPLDDGQGRARAVTPVPVPAVQGGGGGFVPASSTAQNTAQADLEARVRGAGATWTRLDSWVDKGQYKYTCRIPDRQNPQNLKVFEATASDPIAAMQVVLDQIQRKR